MRRTSSKIAAVLLAVGLATTTLPTSVLATQDAEMGEEPVATQGQAGKMVEETSVAPSTAVPELDAEMEVEPLVEESREAVKLTTQATGIYQGTITVQNVIYNRANPVLPKCVVKMGDRVLRENVDYTLEFASAAPEAIIYAHGINEFNSTISARFITVVDASYFDIDPISEQPYTGREIKPALNVKFGRLGLTQKNGDNGQYKVTYKNNVRPGIATATITTDSPYFSGSRDVTFAIKGTPKSFRDVPSSHWAKGVVDEATSIGLLNGYDNGNFGTDDNITRGQVAVVLWNLAGCPAARSGAKSFTDVASDKYYSNAVRWAGSVGVVSGYNNGRFGPDDKVTREQFAAMLGNYAKCVAGIEVSGSAADYASMSDKAKVSNWAVSSVGWCVRNMIISGKTGGRVDPQGRATRAESAKMVVCLRHLFA